MEKVVLKVGEGEEGYHRIVEAFENYRVGNYARVIMVNPLHPNLPKIPIFNMVSCNCFTAELVQSQALLNKSYYEKHLKGVLGPLIGYASDGDSRRRKMFTHYLLSNDGIRFQPVPSELGFVFTAEMIPNETGYDISSLCDQDYIHTHKKLINHLDNKARVLRMGQTTVHLNHIREVLKSCKIWRKGISADFA